MITMMCLRLGRMYRAKDSDGSGYGDLAPDWRAASRKPSDSDDLIGMQMACLKSDSGSIAVSNPSLVFPSRGNVVAPCTSNVSVSTVHQTVDFRTKGMNG